VPGTASLALAVAAQLSLALPGPDAWKRAELGAIRGITVGPIENGYHPGVGYGSAAYDRTLAESRAMGATWVAITPFGRVRDVSGSGIDLTFEAPFQQNRVAVIHAIQMAHAHGLRVMLVPHLWVESGEWRAYIDPGSDPGWARWAESYDRFVGTWATIAQATRVDMLSVGVELRSWVTTARAPSFARIVEHVRRLYRGVLTYSANWDDVEDTVILGDVDVIGINGFYPLADEPGASPAQLHEGGERVRAKVHALAERWQRPVSFTEIGYTTRPDPAVRPWEWPDTMTRVTVDEPAQAAAYRGLVAPLLEEPDFAGFFVWRLYSDPDDVSQEAPWGFSPRGKQAERVVRDAFAAQWAGDAWWMRGRATSAGTPGLYP
jgi:hypothetical protein